VFPIKKLLLPVDYSERSLEAARQARALAGHFHFQVVVLNVLDTSRRTEFQYEVGGFSATELESYFSREFRDDPVEYRIEKGEPGETILRVAGDLPADMIVMSAHNRSPFESFLFGSVMPDVLRSAPCPVWLSLHCEKGPAPLFRRVLCALSFGDLQERTLDWALAFANSFNASCDVIHVSQFGDNLDEQLVTEDQLSGPEREAMTKVRARLADRGRTILRAGALAKVIGTATRDLRSDLLVIGRSHIVGDMELVHNASYRIVCAAPCPVVSI